MTVNLSAQHRRFIARETAIGTVLGAGLPAATMYATFGPFPMEVAGPEGLLWFMAKNALGMGTVMSLLMTLGVRARVRKGTAPALAWNQNGNRWLLTVPVWAPARAVLFGLVALAGPGLLGIAVAACMTGTTVERLPFSLIMAAASAIIALCLIPLILISALADQAQPATTDLTA